MLVAVGLGFGAVDRGLLTKGMCAGGEQVFQQSIEEIMDRFTDCACPSHANRMIPRRFVNALQRARMDVLDR